jgi:hypothetical protein
MDSKKELKRKERKTKIKTNETGNKKAISNRIFNKQKNMMKNKFSKAKRKFVKDRVHSFRISFSDGQYLDLNRNRNRLYLGHLTSKEEQIINEIKRNFTSFYTSFVVAQKISIEHNYPFSYEKKIIL